MILIYNSSPTVKKSLYKLLTTFACLISFASSAQSITPFSKAMQHIEAGQWQQAQALLNFQLDTQPEHHRARLELAMVLMQLKQDQVAKRHLHQLLAVDNLPENVRFNIGVMLEQIRNNETTQTASTEVTPQKSEHTWSSNITVSSGYDSNVRFSFGDYFLEDDPYSDGTYIGLADGSIVFYAPDGNIYNEYGELLAEQAIGFDFGPKKQDTAYVESKLSLDHKYKQGEFEWQNRLLVQNSDNVEFSDFDKLLVKLNTGMSWQLSAQTEITANYQYRALTRGGETLLNSHEISVGYNWLNTLGSFGVYTQWMKRNFHDAETERGAFISFFPGYDTESIALGVHWSRFYFDQRLLSKFTFEYKLNDASDDSDYDGITAKAALVYRLTDKISSAGYVSYFKQSHSAPYYYRQLNDESMKLGVKLDYQLADDLELFFGVDRGFRESDVHGYISSQKTNVKLGISVTFN